jgi:hypothetical protein
MAAPAAPVHPAPRTVIYIDGLNLYYGAVKSTPALKWLNLERFCRLLRPHDDIRRIRYFSALIGGSKRANQETYLRALSTTPLVEVILGKFKMKNAKCGVAACTSNCAKWYLTPEEKRTDVNIAVFMLDDAYQNLCDQFIIISGDSDLVPAVNMVRDVNAPRHVGLREVSNASVAGIWEAQRIPVRCRKYGKAIYKPPSSLKTTWKPSTRRFPALIVHTTRSLRMASMFPA